MGGMHPPPSKRDGLRALGGDFQSFPSFFRFLLMSIPSPRVISSREGNGCGRDIRSMLYVYRLVSARAAPDLEQKNSVWCTCLFAL